ncbi:hypothetical protein CEXT_151501 [Caerostris extrusa]|uniref:Uncharacterized protein n=1 Tax=Caerostris extrusa TaxID=172846 RepID=A0AAV4V7K1_CAEEX|nr:hypothetical protein CEXT_151501 [Caerostris extrusa]
MQQNTFLNRSLIKFGHFKRCPTNDNQFGLSFCSNTVMGGDSSIHPHFGRSMELCNLRPDFSRTPCKRQFVTHGCELSPTAMTTTLNFPAKPCPQWILYFMYGHPDLTLPSDILAPLYWRNGAIPQTSDFIT